MCKKGHGDKANFLVCVCFCSYLKVTYTTGADNSGAIVGGIIGGVALVLVLLAIVVVAVYLLQKRKSNKYKAMSAVGMYLYYQLCESTHKLSYQLNFSLLCEW